MFDLKELFKVKDETWFFVLLLIGIFSSSFLFLFIFKNELIFSLDAFKLILLIFSFCSPLIILNMFFSEWLIFDFNSKSIVSLLNISIASNIFLFDFQILLYFLFDFSFKLAIIGLISGELGAILTMFILYKVNKRNNKNNQKQKSSEVIDT